MYWLASPPTPPRPAGALLLHGITGSGKTEVYLRAAACALERGRGAIVLVPEIALTPQIVGRFVARFGETVAVLHSRLTPAQRREEWRRLRVGEARVCVGPRSAVFAPIEDLGLIVVDEEHDSSYKHEGDPRYDARDVAARRAAQQGALLLVGSATPRPESHHALRRLRLPRRVDGRPLPPVEVLDMREQSHGLHPETAQALAEVRREGGQGDRAAQPQGLVELPLLPLLREGVELPAVRRGAGAAPRGGAGGLPPLRPPRACAGALRLRLDGGGAPRRRHRAPAARPAGGAGGRRALPDLPAGRRRARRRTRRRTAWARCCAASATAPAGVLIGTQMVAKGHDFPDVSLGVVRRRGRDAALPGLPRGGAHVRADRAARGPGGARRGGEGAGADDRPRGARDRARGAARQRGLPRGRAGAPSGAALPAVRAPDPDRVRRPGGGARAGGGERGQGGHG